jgi:hypothetical protein
MQCAVKQWATAARATLTPALSLQPYDAFFTYDPSMPRHALRFVHLTQLVAPFLQWPSLLYFAKAAWHFPLPTTMCLYQSSTRKPYALLVPPHF